LFFLRIARATLSSRAARTSLLLVFPPLSPVDCTNTDWELGLSGFFLSPQPGVEAGEVNHLPSLFLLQFLFVHSQPIYTNHLPSSFFSLPSLAATAIIPFSAFPPAIRMGRAVWHHLFVGSEVTEKYVLFSSGVFPSRFIIGSAGLSMVDDCPFFFSWFFFCFGLWD